MSDLFNLFIGKEKFDSILEKIISDNKNIFEEANISYEECCVFVSQDNKISLAEVNRKLPISIKNLILREWKEFCENKKG